MNEAETLADMEDLWRTSMGAWFPGKRVVFRGKDLFHDLKDIPWMGLLLYGITGRMPDKKLIRLFEGVWVLCISYPDPRLWNNRVAALGGTARTTAALAISAANAVTEATVYGGRPILRSIDFLVKTEKQLQSGQSLESIIKQELKQYRAIAGYGRPIVREDERIKPVMALAEELDFADGKYLKLAFDIEEVLSNGRWRYRMNIAAVVAGLAADQGFSSHDYYMYLVLGFSGGMFPCFIDAKNQAESAFFPLRCTSIDYTGEGPRSWG